AAKFSPNKPFANPDNLPPYGLVAKTFDFSGPVLLLTRLLAAVDGHHMFSRRNIFYGLTHDFAERGNRRVLARLGSADNVDRSSLGHSNLLGARSELAIRLSPRAHVTFLRQLNDAAQTFRHTKRVTAEGAAGEPRSF